MQTNSFHNMGSTVIGVERNYHEYTEEGVIQQKHHGEGKLEQGTGRCETVGQEDVEMLGIAGRR